MKVISTNQVSASSQRAILLSPSDAELVREHIGHSIAAMQETIELERVFGNRSPILRELARYADDARALLKRIS